MRFLIDSILVEVVLQDKAGGFTNRRVSVCERSCFLLRLCLQLLRKHASVDGNHLHLVISHGTNNPRKSSLLTLLVKYALRTIHTTVSAISSVLPNLPTGISATKNQHLHLPQKPLLLPKTRRNSLLANSSPPPGNIPVSSINAGATALTVTPFVAKAPASQCTSPCSALLLLA